MHNMGETKNRQMKLDKNDLLSVLKLFWLELLWLSGIGEKNFTE